MKNDRRYLALARRWNYPLENLGEPSPYIIRLMMFIICKMPKRQKEHNQNPDKQESPKISKEISYISNRELVTEELVTVDTDWEASGGQVIRDVPGKMALKALKAKNNWHYDDCIGVLKH